MSVATAKVFGVSKILQVNKQACNPNQCLIFRNIESSSSLIRRIVTRLLYRFNCNSRFRCFTTLTCWLSDLLSENSVREPAGGGESLQSSEPSTEQAGVATTVSLRDLIGMYILLTSFFQFFWT